MSTSLFCTQDIVKYIIIGGLVYSILKLIPSQQISNKDLLLVLAIICISFISLDCVLNKMNNKPNQEAFTSEPNQDNSDSNPSSPRGRRKVRDGKDKEADEHKEPKEHKEPNEHKSTRSPRATDREERKMNDDKNKENNDNKTQSSNTRSEPVSPRSKLGLKRSEEVAESELVDRPRISSRSNESVRSESEQLPKVGCSLEVEKIKRELRGEIEFLKGQLELRNESTTNDKIAQKYFENLINELHDKGILDDGDIQNIKAKMNSKLLTIEEVINSLETLHKEGKVKVLDKTKSDGKRTNDMDYTELPTDFYRPIGDKIANEWENDYTILNTNKWQVPMPRPPVCINTTPCKVCPSLSSDNVVALKEWDNSRYVSQNKINKKWASEQASST